MIANCDEIAEFVSEFGSAGSLFNTGSKERYTNDGQIIKDVVDGRLRAYLRMTISVKPEFR